MLKNVNKLAIIATIGMLVLLVIAGIIVNTRPSASAHDAKSAHSHIQLAFTTLRHYPVGQAELNWDAKTKNLDVTITMTGLAPKSTHPAHIHLDTCDKMGAVKYPLNNVVADAAGNAHVSTTIANVDAGVPATGWSVNVHNGPMLNAADQFAPIACGNVKNHHADADHNQHVKVALGATMAANQAASGVAFLTLHNGTLTVFVAAHGMAPNSQHAIHIHAGSCEAQGPPIYMLNNLTADAHGDATAVATFQNVKSIPAQGWYINIHFSTDLATQTGFDPIACGNVKNTL